MNLFYGRKNAYELDPVIGLEFIGEIKSIIHIIFDIKNLSECFDFVWMIFYYVSNNINKKLIKYLLKIFNETLFCIAEN